MISIPPREGDIARVASGHAVQFDEVLPHAPWPGRHGHASTVHNGRLWVLDGATVSHANAMLGDVWSSADGRNWTLEVAAAPWPARSRHDVLAYDGRLWIMGGMHLNSPRENLNDVWSSPDGRNWTQETAHAPWSPRHVFGVAVHTGKMWVIGGAPDGKVFHNDVWSSTDGRTWEEAPVSGARFSPRKNLSCVSVDGELWLTGGAALVDNVPSGPTTLLNDVWSSPDGVEWTQRVAHAGWSPRRMPGLKRYQDAFWVSGGLVGRSAVRDLWRSSDGVTCTCVTDAPPWLARHSGVQVVFNGSVWVLGGCAVFGEPNLNDIWRYTAGKA